MVSPSPHHIVILGCGRSGTSIFGELFEHLPGYTYYSEPPFADLPTYDYTTPVAVKVPTESPGYPPTPGLSFPPDTLMATVPEPRTLYWQMRHPLDTICSLRVGIANNWGHHPKPPDWQGWLDRPLLERCAHHWNYLNSVGFAQVAAWCTISRFETMIADPLSFANNVCHTAGIDAHLYATAITDWAQRVQNTNNPKFVEAKTSRAYSRPDHRVRVDRWQENLTKREIAQIRPIVQATAERFGYVL